MSLGEPVSPDFGIKITDLIYRSGNQEHWNTGCYMAKGHELHNLLPPDSKQSDLMFDECGSAGQRKV